MRVLIAGTGAMAWEYARVIGERLGGTFDVCGRDRGKFERFKKLKGAGDFRLFTELGDLRDFDFAVTATSIDSLHEVSCQLLDSGIRKLLIEKPVSLHLEKILSLKKKSEERDAVVRVACNRRYYGSIAALQQILKKDLPCCAFFDFTEWLTRVPESWKQGDSGKYLALANSIHIFDTMVFLLGPYRPIHSATSGENEVAWHPHASVFTGTGHFGNCPASYATSWISPGRWNIEIMAGQGRYRLSPMEKLQVLKHESVVWEEFAQEPDDIHYKPGLVRMLEAFDSLEKSGTSAHPSLGEYHANAGLFSRMVGYTA